MKPAAEHRYTTAERRQQLQALTVLLADLIEATESLPQMAQLVPRYRLALEQTQKLLGSGFTQEQLSGLGRAIPDAFVRHKDWLPPLEQAANGSWREPEWFTMLEARLQPTMKAARLLCELGYY